MEFKKLQNKIAKIFLDNADRDKIKVSNDYLILKLTEELGEFAQAYLVEQKRCRPEKYLSSQESKKQLAKELADVIGLIFTLTKTLNIDIEEALVKKFITKEWLKK